MEDWASTPSYTSPTGARDMVKDAVQPFKVQFLCACVDPEAMAVASMFARLFGFQNSIMGFIPGRQYMPVGYGQLGCSGFIVVDRKGRFLSRKTRAYLQTGENAFRHVERMIFEELTRIDKEITKKIGTRSLSNKSSTSNKTKSTSTTTTTNETKIPEDGDNEQQNLKKQRTKNSNISDDGDNEQQKPKKQKAKLTSIHNPPSVGVVVMDEEHEECTEALNAFLRNPTKPILQAVLETLESHFQHEEELLLKNGYSATDTFSPYHSHRKDHERILKIGKDVLLSLSSC